ncbi:heavy metal translocating P-type ATPase [Roseospira marina]|uniref:Heavy metal translocating P-type ATPase n=1 Tax=Roseospira marina TaxID=140057 RepID=A0A5M6II91_9PROT|nr:heavy metal translocating P-type ATPase metal-binding domain-containing protein [Roseospira marina]KAA5607288.1 heavy metal translocating P-type ATPase [Roseospira marina]MBB4312557.1 Cu2+-exporting ATPase [Roseospira marina]MBB5085427.1 Cu2+-exporting ATPase [Roseospira marina]
MAEPHPVEPDSAQPSADPVGTHCCHCGEPITDDGSAAGRPGFCCTGCEAAFKLVNGLGLDRYYERRCLDPDTRALKPESDPDAIPDYTPHLSEGAQGGEVTLPLLVEGLHCAACVWLIERLLTLQPGVAQARVNMTTRRLTLRWTPQADQGDTTAPDRGARRILDPVLTVGYRLVPYDPATLDQDTDRTEKALLRAMAVAGFAAGNIMLFSVSVWFGGDMDPATRDLMHWLSAVIAVPAIGYGIRPFARSAVASLRAGRANMDVPITLAVLLAASMSLWETARGGPHAYFDAAVMLLFFLLIGRYLDSRARGRARSAAAYLLALGGRAVTVIGADGATRASRPDQVPVGATVLVAAGERVGIDGVVATGVSDLDGSLITGETLPARAGPGTRVFAGTLNLSAPLRVKVAAVGEQTLLAEIVRMMEAAEQGRARYVALADRVARLYAPVVHGLALSAFFGWWLVGGLPWQEALLIAAAVLIITCPCALALAVPVVQVIASGRLLRSGVFLKSATALERLTEADTVVFDKTGTLTRGQLALRPGGLDTAGSGGGWTPDDLRLAAGLAANSRHPLARAVAAAAPETPPFGDVREHPGEGLSWADPTGAPQVRLGSAVFCGVDGTRGDHPGAHAEGPELWLRRGHAAPVCFRFTDSLRSDAAAVVAELRARGVAVELLSGDRTETVAAVACAAGVETWHAGQTPAGKVARLEALRAEGRRVLMVGDGLNDAPALAAAHVSASPASAVDVSQTAADLVFQGERLAPLLESMDVAVRADRLVKLNVGFAFAYNAVTIPLALAGLVTPLIAAAAMSTSSLIVIGNALRLSQRGTALRTEKGGSAS